VRIERGAQEAPPISTICAVVSAADSSRASS
jgi:hypothetical protein